MINIDIVIGVLAALDITILVFLIVYTVDRISNNKPINSYKRV